MAAVDARAIGKSLSGADPADASGRLLHPIGSPEEAAALASFRGSGAGERERAALAAGGDFWQLACLRWADFARDKAMARLVAYTEWRREAELAVTPALRAAVMNMVVWVPGSRDKRGRYLVCLDLSRSEQALELQEIVAGFHLAVVETALREWPGAQACGFLLCNNMANVQRSQLNFRAPGAIMSALSGRWPVRLGGIRPIQPPLMLRFIFPVVKLFMKKKLRQRMK